MADCAVKQNQPCVMDAAQLTVQQPVRAACRESVRRGGGGGGGGGGGDVDGSV